MAYATTSTRPRGAERPRLPPSKRSDNGHGKAAAGRKPDCGRATRERLLHPRIERVAQGVSQEIEAEHHQHNRQAGEGGYVRGDR